MKRVILIVSILAVIAVVAVGIYWVLHRNTGLKLLQRSQLAIKAEQFQRAVDLADSYIAGNPRDWQGYQTRGEALVRLGRYDDARESLCVAARLKPGRPAIAIDWASTYSVPARRVLQDEEAGARQADLQRAIGQLRLSNAILAGEILLPRMENVDDPVVSAAVRAYQPAWKALREDLLDTDREPTSRPAEQLDPLADRVIEAAAGLGVLWERQGVRDAVDRAGRNYTDLAAAYDIQTEALQDAAEVAQLARDPERAAEHRRRSEEAARRARRQAEHAIVCLQAVIRQDPTDESAAQTLLALCRRHDRLEDLRELRDAVHTLPPEQRPPLVVMRLARLGLWNELDSPTPAERLADTSRVIDELIELHPENTDLMVTRARLALEAGDLPKARQCVNDALEQNPREPVARLLRGQILMREGRPDEAEADLFQLKTERQNLAAAHYAYGMAVAQTEMNLPRSQRTRTQLAREAMRRAVELQPSHAGARAFLARSLLRDGFYERASADAWEYLKAYPDSPEALRLYVLSACFADQRTRAREAVEEFYALRQSPDALQLIAEVAGGYYPELREVDPETGLPGDAESAQHVVPNIIGPTVASLIARTIEEHPDDPAILAAAMNASDRVRSAAQARQIAERLVEIEPDSPTAAAAVAQGAIRLGRTREAEALLTEAITTSPDDADLRFQLGRVFTGTGRAAQAIEQFRTALELRPHDRDCRLLLAQSLYQRGELDECETVLDKLPSEDAPANLLRLRVHLARGETEESEDVLRRIPEVQRRGALRAWAYYYAGELDRAVQACRTGLEEDPDNAPLRELLAVCHARRGEMDQAVEQLRAAIELAPGNMALYRRLGAIWARDLEPAAVRERLTAVPGARDDVVDMTMGQLYLQARRFEDAAAAYTRISRDPEASEAVRTWARIRSAMAVALGGDGERALRELDDVAAIPAHRRQALTAKTDVLVALGRRDEAADLLGELVDPEGGTTDADLLAFAIPRLTRLGRFQPALQACDRLEQLRPGPDVDRLRAVALREAGRPEEAASALTRVIDAQPDNFGTYATLAQLYDGMQQRRRALEVLNRLKGRGETGRAAALGQKGVLFVRWGLQAKAAETFEELMTTHRDQSPSLFLAMGTAFGQLGQRDRALDLLAQIPPYAEPYARARMLMVQLAEDTDRKLEILDELEADRPGRADVMVRRIEILLSAGRADQAADVFEQSLTDPTRLSAEAGEAGLRALLEADRWDTAARFAGDVAERTGSDLWRQRAVLLTFGQDPAAAHDLLPPPDQASRSTAIVGVTVSEDAAGRRQWADRVEQANRQAATQPNTAGLSPSYELLLAVATGNREWARASLDSFAGARSIAHSAAEEMVAYAQDDPDAAADEAVRLLRAAAAYDLDMPLLGESLAMDVLRERPESQWAAELAVLRTDEATRLEEVVATLQPDDSIPALRVRALQAGRRDDPARAAELLAEAARRSGSPAIALEWAQALEAARQRSEALEIYDRVWTETRSPVAANNYAYLVAMLHPDDSDRLAEAAERLEQAAERLGGVAALQDTLGWIAHLQGDDERACRLIGRAVRALPGSIEVQAHLGVVETAAGDPELGRWHLEQAVRRAEAVGERRELTESETQALQTARRALSREVQAVGAAS